MRVGGVGLVLRPPPRPTGAGAGAGAAVGDEFTNPNPEAVDEGAAELVEGEARVWADLRRSISALVCAICCSTESIWGEEPPTPAGLPDEPIPPIPAPAPAPPDPIDPIDPMLLLLPLCCIIPGPPPLPPTVLFLPKEARKSSSSMSAAFANTEKEPEPEAEPGAEAPAATPADREPVEGEEEAAVAEGEAP